MLQVAIANHRVIVMEQQAAKTRYENELLARDNIPVIETLRDRDDFTGALQLAQVTAVSLPDDRTVAKLIGQVSGVVSIESTPAGAEVSVRYVKKLIEGWAPLGKTPDSNGWPAAPFISGSQRTGTMGSRPGTCSCQSGARDQAAEGRRFSSRDDLRQPQ